MCVKRSRERPEIRRQQVKSGWLAARRPEPFEKRQVTKKLSLVRRQMICVRLDTARELPPWDVFRLIMRENPSSQSSTPGATSIPATVIFRERANDVKRGVWQAGGFPVEMPAMTLGETFQKPTTMLYRNFLAMETEELLRSYPVDGCVLLGGCDKTTPALLMGAISMNVPAIFVPAGPMLRGNWRGQVLGSGSDVWKYWAERRAGNIDQQAWQEVEQGIARSAGTCMTMGTASTMTSLAEVLGFSLPGASSIPAVDSNHPKMASSSAGASSRWYGRT